jgi:catalase
MPTSIAADILEGLDALGGEIHSGFRPVHARGVMIAGTFAPATTAATLTRAPQATRPSTPVTARFSIAAGVPSAAENDAAVAGPQGMAIRFHLAEHEHTDIVAHSHDGFPVHTPEEFLEFVRAAGASGPGAPNPPPVAVFMSTHPAAAAYVTAPKPLPVSFARQAFFAVNAFKFTNASGASRFGRFRIRPVAGTEFLTPEQGAKKTSDYLDAEMSERLAKGPAKFQVFVQLAEPGDEVTDSTVSWPTTRSEIEFGTITLTGKLDELAPEQRKIIFDPLPRVDGIDSAGDPLTALRADIYLLSGRRRRQAAK